MGRRAPAPARVAAECTGAAARPSSSAPHLPPFPPFLSLPKVWMKLHVELSAGQIRRDMAALLPLTGHEGDRYPSPCPLAFPRMQGCSGVAPACRHILVLSQCLPAAVALSCDSFLLPLTLPAAPREPTSRRSCWSAPSTRRPCARAGGSCPPWAATATRPRQHSAAPCAGRRSLQRHPPRPPPRGIGRTARSALCGGPPGTPERRSLRSVAR